MVSDVDKIFWLRAGLGVVTGTAADLIFWSDYSNGILIGLIVFLASYYLSRFVWGKKLPQEQLGKLYTSGIGSYIMLFIFFWLFLYTLGFHYLTLVLAPLLS